MTNTEKHTYVVTVTDYVTNKSATYTLDAPDGDEAFEAAGRQLDPTETHTIGGSFHRLDIKTNPTHDWGLR